MMDNEYSYVRPLETRTVGYVLETLGKYAISGSRHDAECVENLIGDFGIILPFSEIVRLLQPGSRHGQHNALLIPQIASITILLDAFPFKVIKLEQHHYGQYSKVIAHLGIHQDDHAVRPKYSVNEYLAYFSTDEVATMVRMSL